MQAAIDRQCGSSGGPGLGLFTDLYELTMLQAYFEEGWNDSAVFTLFVRRLPERRNYLVACGLDTLLADLEALRFDDDEIAYLDSLDQFKPAFLEWLRDFRFTGAVYALPEGTVCFPNEPILEVVAPIAEAQLIETLVMNQVHLQTVLASKAARMTTAAAGAPILDFGARRTHGIDAAVKGARAFHVAGIAGTSNMLAGYRFGVPVRGTMAHSYIQAHENERAAFEAFASLYPETTLLVDTYDTRQGVQEVIDLARRLGDDFRVTGVRLDSGDLGALAHEARQMLDAAGLPQVKVVASGGLDEDAIADLVADGAPIDGFGVGTSLGVAGDAPDLDIAYKLAEYAGRGRLKLSSGKPILPGRKQVYRQTEDGQFAGDVIAREGEDLAGEPLLVPVMKEGRRLPRHVTDLDTMRAYAAEQIAQLPAAIRSISPAPSAYPVTISEALQRHHDAVRQRVAANAKPLTETVHADEK